MPMTNPISSSHKKNILESTEKKMKSIVSNQRDDKKSGPLPKSESKYNSQRTGNGFIEKSKVEITDISNFQNIIDDLRTPLKQGSPTQSSFVGNQRGKSHNAINQDMPIELQQHMEKLKMR